MANHSLAMRAAAAAALAICTLEASPQAVGAWKNHLSYHTAEEIEPAAGKVFVKASGSLYAYDPADKSVTPLDKVSGLADCDIAHIAWCQEARRLVVAYSNGNIDLVGSDYAAVNLPHFYNKSMTEAKDVNHIYVSGRHAYLSTNFGVLKVDAASAEISDTYNLGHKIDYTYIKDGKLYAACMTEGIYSAPLTANLANPGAWEKKDSYVYADFSKTDVEDRWNKCRWEVQPDGTVASYVGDGEEKTYTATGIRPDGPAANHFGFMKMHGGSLYTTVGGYSTSMQLNRPGNVQILSKDGWTVYSEDVAAATGHSYMNTSVVAIDPVQPGHIAIAGRTGIYEFEDGKMARHYYSENSPLDYSYDLGNPSKNYSIVHAMEYDKDGNLWFANSQSKSGSLYMIDRNGEWVSHDNDLFKNSKGSLKNLSCMTFDSNGLMWFCNKDWQDYSIFSYDTKTRTAHRYDRFVNQDGAEFGTSSINCVAEDKEGNIWAGSQQGPMVIPKGDIGADDYVINQVKVPRGDGSGLADYLLQGVDVTDIAVDGGGRKWIATGSQGVFLISKDNETELAHFTEENSPLLSDNVESVEIDGATGEVFFGTGNGLCSYVGDATEATPEMAGGGVYAYPNPVEPGYTGPITIKGLSANADVKITTVSGRPVAEGRSNGGTFVWDGSDPSGGMAPSGVYLVHTATAEGKKGPVAKIAIVR